MVEMSIVIHEKGRVPLPLGPANPANAQRIPLRVNPDTLPDLTVNLSAPTSLPYTGVAQIAIIVETALSQAAVE
jgi:hypothetical protein